MWGETTRVENRGETTRGETTRGETSWGRNVLLPCNGSCQISGTSVPGVTSLSFKNPSSNIDSQSTSGYLKLSHGGTLIFSYIRRLGSFFGVQNFEFQYFLGFLEK